jgi:hypothetical protein
VWRRRERGDPALSASSSLPGSCITQVGLGGGGPLISGILYVASAIDSLPVAEAAWGRGWSRFSFFFPLLFFFPFSFFYFSCFFFISCFFIYFYFYFSIFLFPFFFLF